MERFRVIFIAIFALLLSSCGNKVKDISVTSFNIVSIAPQGLTGITALVEIGIHNPTVGFEITNLNAIIKMKGQEMIYLSADQLMVEGHSEKQYDIPVKGRLADGFNPFQLLKLLSNEADIEDMTLSISARPALRGGVGKVVEINDMPLKKLIDKI